MRLSRNRNWAHPALLALIEKLAEDAQAKDGWPGLLVGDISQPRGGPMLTGHASHQVGLDADIWLTPMPSRTLTAREREDMKPQEMVKNRKELDRSVWTEAHARLIKRAASYPEVMRIFVHPPIKKALCDWGLAQPGSHAWLAKVRPYYNHTFHFHVRIRCPKGSDDCKDQPMPEPAGRHGLRHRARLLVHRKAVGEAAAARRAQAAGARADDVGAAERVPGDPVDQIVRRLTIPPTLVMGKAWKCRSRSAPW